MIGDFKNVNLAWVNKNAVIGYNWLFVYESSHSYEEGMLVPPRLYEVSSAVFARV